MFLTVFVTVFSSLSNFNLKENRERQGTKESNSKNSKLKSDFLFCALIL